VCNVLLETKDLKKYFDTSRGRLHAVDGISLSIREGETLGVVGESGCGKSTLGRVLMRLLDATSGEVLFNGENILSYQDKQMRELRKQMQIIFQDPYSSLDPRMTIRELIAHPLKVNRVFSGRAEQTKRVKELMDTGAAAKEIVTIAMKSEMNNMDPFLNTTTIDWATRANWYETLLVYYGGQFEMLLCDSYNISGDGLVYTFNLKHGVKFHNGSEMTSEDVVYSLEKGLGTPSYSGEAAYVSAIRAVDDYTVEVQLKQIYSPFLIGVGTRLCILNKAYVEEKGEQEAYNKPIGTGAYKLTERIIGQKLVLDAFEDWHEGSPAVKRAELIVVADPTSAQMALESQEVDMTYIIPSIAVAAMESDPRFAVERVVALGCGYWVYNLEKYPFNDVNFRQALAHAMDRDKTIAAALDGIPPKSVGVWNQEFVGYTGNTVFDDVDLDLAREYLAKSSYKGETIHVTIGNETYKRIAVIAQEDLRNIGINIDVQQVEINSWISDMSNGNYEMAFVNASVAADVGRDYLKENAIVIPIYFPTVKPAYDASLSVERFYADGYARICDMAWK